MQPKEKIEKKRNETLTSIDPDEMKNAGTNANRNATKTNAETTTK